MGIRLRSPFKGGKPRSPVQVKGNPLPDIDLKDLEKQVEGLVKKAVDELAGAFYKVVKPSLIKFYKSFDGVKGNAGINFKGQFISVAIEFEVSTEIIKNVRKYIDSPPKSFGDFLQMVQDLGVENIKPQFAGSVPAFEGIGVDFWGGFDLENFKIFVKNLEKNFG